MVARYKPSERCSDASIFGDAILPTWPTLDQAPCSNEKLSTPVVTNGDGEAAWLPGSLSQ